MHAASVGKHSGRKTTPPGDADISRGSMREQMAAAAKFSTVNVLYDMGVCQLVCDTANIAA